MIYREHFTTSLGNCSLIILRQNFIYFHKVCLTQQLHEKKKSISHVWLIPIYKTFESNVEYSLPETSILLSK